MTAVTLGFYEQLPFTCTPRSRVSPQLEQDILPFLGKEILGSAMREEESQRITVTYSLTREHCVAELLTHKKQYISLRNKILDNFFKYYNPLYRYKLKKIDAKLDEIELEIYTLEKQHYFESDLKFMLNEAKARLKKNLADLKLG